MDRLKINDGDFQLEFPSRGKHSIVLLYNGKTVFSCGRILCGKFSEVGALEKKFRIHSNQDCLSAEIESTNIIPFGCEYEISRDINASSGFLRITEDIRAVNFGRVGDVTLEEVRFPAEGASLEYLVCGEDTMRKVSADDFTANIYSGSEPVVMASVTLPDGIKVDFGCGSDLWRLRSASGMNGVDSLFTISCEDDELVLRRMPLIYAADTEVEQRPWRFKSFAAWSKAGAVPEVPENAFKFTNAVCMLAPAARRDFRKKVRRSSSDTVCTGCVPALCCDAAHLEKPEKKELIHFDMEEYISSFVWANRQLNKSGNTFVYSFADNIFSGTAAVKNLSEPIRQLEFTDREED